MRGIILLIAIALLNWSSSAAQDGEIYIQVDYMKPLEGMSEDYVWMENMVYKPIHQERINNGEIVAWHLYEVRYPRGAEMEYDYITLTIFGDFSSLDAETVPFEQIVAKVHPSKTVEEVEAFATTTRKIVRSEVFKSLHRYPPQTDDPSRTLLLDYMKVEPINKYEYIRMEEEVWEPLHKERLSRETIASWGVYELLFPGGMNYPYTFATATGFDEWEDMKDAWPDDIWAKVHPGKSQTELEQDAHKTRDLVSTQIWRLIDYTVAPSR